MMIIRRPAALSFDCNDGQWKLSLLLSFSFALVRVVCICVIRFSLLDDDNSSGNQAN